MNIINKVGTTKNYWTGRNGRSVIAIVDHITDGTMPGSLEWLQNSESQASAHYIVARTGDIYKLVNESASGLACRGCQWMYLEPLRRH